MTQPTIKFKLLREGATLPKRGTAHSGALDMFAPEPGQLEPGERKLIGMGISHEIPDDINIELMEMPREGQPEQQTLTLEFRGLILPRSGLATRHGVKPDFSPCLIDNDYRGEIMVLLHNSGQHRFSWKAGERLCQIAYVPMYAGGVEVTDTLNETQRGDGGFGSTGR